MELNERVVNLAPGAKAIPVELEYRESKVMLVYVVLLALEVNKVYQDLSIQ